MKNHVTKRLMLMTSILVMLFLGSCGDGSPVKEGHVEAEHKHHLRVDAKDWKDNDQDFVKEVINHSVEIVNPEEALDGGKACVFVCEDGCVFFKNHLFENYKRTGAA